MSNFKKRFVIIKAIIVLISPVIVGLFPTERAYACSCVMPGTPEEEFKEFDAVFMGTVASISERPAPNHFSEIDKAFYPKVKIGINVGRSWKGVATDFVYVHTGYGGGDCGYQVTGFDTYLFYAYGPIDDLSISICSRTAWYNGAQEDRSYLESLSALPLTKVTRQGDMMIENNQNGTIIILGGLTTVLFIATIYLIVLNRKMKKELYK
jgi:hypothetical protein